MEDPGVDGRIIVKWILMKWDEGMGWIDVAHNRDKWPALVKAVIKIRGRKMRGNARLADNLLASQAGLCSTALIS
jgi:hypothetical protein